MKTTHKLHSLFTDGNTGYRGEKTRDRERGSLFNWRITIDYQAGKTKKRSGHERMKNEV